MNAATKPKHRVVTALQSTGRLGKSTVLEAFASWLDFAGVPFAGADLDGDHRTFSDKLNGAGVERVGAFSLDQPDHLDDALRSVNIAPVVLMDVPAGGTERILDHIVNARVLDAMEEKGARWTVFVFSSPDPTAGHSLGHIFHVLKDHADFIIVRNPARFSSDEFERTSGREDLRARNTPTITMPAMSGGTLREVTELQDAKQRFFTLAEAKSQLGVDSRFAVDAFLGSMFRQFEENASILVPEGTEFRRMPKAPARAERTPRPRFASPTRWGTSATATASAPSAPVTPPKK